MEGVALGKLVGYNGGRVLWEETGMPQVNEDRDGILKGIECFLLDLDGTVYLEDSWIPGAVEFLRRVEERGRKYYFLTNNSSRCAEDYVEKFRRMGFPVGREKIIASGEVTAAYVKERYPHEPVFVLGNESLKREFTSRGIALTEEGAKVLVTGFDTTLTYRTMTIACDLARRGVPYIATHPDFNCPVKGGFIPDIGAIEAFIAASTGRHPDVILGKPHGGIVEYALKRAGAERKKTAMVGDRLYTDIPAGVRNGLVSIFVLSGEGKLEELPRYQEQPNLVFSSVREMVELL